jgi:hypothetical protein
VFCQALQKGIKMSRELFNYTELMPYNELAGAKYPMVGMHFSLKEMKKLIM